MLPCNHDNYLKLLKFSQIWLTHWQKEWFFMYNNISSCHTLNKRIFSTTSPSQLHDMHFLSWSSQKILKNNVNQFGVEEGEGWSWWQGVAAGGKEKTRTEKCCGKNSQFTTDQKESPQKIINEKPVTFFVQTSIRNFNIPYLLSRKRLS